MDTEPFFLTENEVCQLTGYKQPAKQREHLRRIGIAFTPAANGRPVVCRSTVEGFKNKKQPTAKPQAQWRPAIMKG